MALLLSGAGRAQGCMEYTGDQMGEGAWWCTGDGTEAFSGTAAAKACMQVAPQVGRCRGVLPADTNAVGMVDWSC